MDPDAALQQRQHRPLVGLKRRYAQDGVPAALDLETAYLRQTGQLPVKLGQVGRRAPPNLLLNRLAAFEPCGERALYRRVHREKRIGNDLQALLRRKGLWPGSHNPGRLHLRQPCNLAQPADHEDWDAFDTRGKAHRLTAEAPREFIVEKNLVHNQRKIELPAYLRQFFRLPRLREVACGVVRVHQDDSSRQGRNGASKALRIDLPAVVVDERHRFDAHIVQHSQKVEERIAGLGNKNFAARVAKQPEKKAISLAGAGGQRDLLGLERNAMAGIVIADGLAGAQQAARLRIVVECLGVRERRKKLGIIGKAAAGGVRGRQVGNRFARLGAQPVRPRQPAFFRVPVCSLRKTHPSPSALILKPIALFTRPPTRMGSCTIEAGVLLNI